MNKLVSVALAGAVAAAAIAATAGSASADGWQPGWQPHYAKPHFAKPHYPGPRPYDAGPAIVTGAILGLALGALAAQPYYSPYPPPPPPEQYYPTYAPTYSPRHFNWCAATYDTYNSATDTWMTRATGVAWGHSRPRTEPSPPKRFQSAPQTEKQHETLSRN
jgi:hypothetical protein